MARRVDRVAPVVTVAVGDVLLELAVAARPAAFIASFARAGAGLHDVADPVGDLEVRPLVLAADDVAGARRAALEHSEQRPPWSSTCSQSRTWRPSP
jgi:hypothetical protein